MIDAAVADSSPSPTNGTDVLLMAANHALRRELSRRIRDDLSASGSSNPGPRRANRRRSLGELSGTRSCAPATITR